jgi:hypothetical protein
MGRSEVCTTIYIAISAVYMLQGDMGLDTLVLADP